LLATDHFVVQSMRTPYEPIPPRDRDLTVKDIMRFIRRSWRLCLVWIVISLGIGAAFVTFSPRYYSAYATILLSAPPAPQVEGAEVDARNYVDSQIQVILSDEVVGRAVDHAGLLEDKDFVRADYGLRARVSGFLRNQLAFLFGAEGPAVDRNPRHEATVLVRYALSVRQLGFSNAVEIGFTSNDPQFSAKLVNAIASSYIENQRDLRLAARAEAASDLQRRLADLRDRAFGTEALKAISPDTSSEDEARVRFREQQSTTEVYRSLYNSLLQRAHSDPSASSLITSARVITSGEPPRRRSWPPMVLVMALSVVGGGLGGIGHALIRQATDHSLRSVKEVRRSIGLDRIAGIPRIPRRRWKFLKARDKCLQRSYLWSSPSLHGTLSKIAGRMRGVQGLQDGFVIGVASPLATSGSSTVAAHLARVIAETGQRTLLVDANWQKPLAGKPMLNAEPGRKLARAFATIPIPGDDEGLVVLVLRAAHPTSELNASLSIATTLRYLQQEYDCVVVDFHSTDQTADLEMAMGVISEVLVVARARYTSSDDLEGLLRVIPPAKLAAVFLNRSQV